MKTTIVYDARPWEEAIRQTSSSDLVFFFERFQIGEAWKASMLEPSVFMEQYFLEDTKKLLVFLNEESVELLLLLWEARDSIELNYMDFQCIPSLELLGLIKYQRKEDCMLVNEEAKTNFYFYLKSRTSSKWVKKYQEFSYMIKGLLYQYGILTFLELYDRMKEKIPMSKQQFYQFLVGRGELWSHIAILSEQGKQIFYVSGPHLKEREHIFARYFEHLNQDLKRIDDEEALFLGRMDGIGPWKGTKDLLRIFLDDLCESTMEATILMKELLIMIQNGRSLESIYEKMSKKWQGQEKEEIEDMKECLNDMYWNVPIFGAKGYSRIEKEENQEVSFRVIPGGKKDEKNAEEETSKK